MDAFRISQSIGVATSSVFVGGNIAQNVVYLPSMRKYGTPLSHIQRFADSFSRASKFFASLNAVSAVAFGSAAYHAPQRHLLQLCVTSCVLSVWILPFTLIFIKPLFEPLLEIAKNNDEGRANKESAAVLDQWARMSAIRASFAAVAWLTGIYTLARS